jgi:hypothetical protein
MLDISPIVAGIICQIGTGTFGKTGEAGFNPAIIPGLRPNIACAAHRRCHH